MTAHQLDLFPVAVHLRRIDPNRNMHRFYRLGLQPDLFGGCTVIREWGRIGSGGTVRIDNYPDEGQAVDALLGVATAKKLRGVTNLPTPGRFRMRLLTLKSSITT